MLTEEIVLFVKTYSNDFKILKRLLNSIEKFNKDNIPVYVSIPKADENLFNTVFYSQKNKINLIFDENIVQIDGQYRSMEHGGYFQQQVVKLSFGLKNIANFFVVIDSDSFFTKTFSKKDFLYSGRAFTRIGEPRTYFATLINKNKKNIEKEYNEVSTKIKEYIGNNNPRIYGYGPTPVVWDTEVIQALFNFASQRGDTFTSLINYAPYELNWYGEAIIKFFPEKILICEPLFKCLSYKREYFEYILKNDNIQSYYLGVVMQSAWLRDYPFLLKINPSDGTRVCKKISHC